MVAFFKLCESSVLVFIKVMDSPYFIECKVVSDRLHLLAIVVVFR